jgi:hypothetical protein
MAPLDPDDQEQAQQAAEERKLLNKLRLRSITATPGTVEPFQQVTLAWNVDVPASVTNEIDVTFTVGNKPVSNPGTLPVSALVTGGFQLVAHSENTSRTMGTAIVNVNLGDLQEGSLSLASITTAARQVQGQLHAGNISVRKDVDVEMLPSDGMRLKVYLRAEVEDYFDANIDATLDFNLSVVNQAGGGRAVAAQLVRVDDDISFDIIDHILSLGTATAAQAILQPFLAELIKGFLGPRIEQTLAAGLQTAIDVFFTLFQSADPKRRAFRLYSVETTANSLVFFGNPVTPSVPPPPPPVIVNTPARRTKVVHNGATKSRVVLG